MVDDRDRESLSEALGRLQDASAGLSRAELAVTASRHAPELRRAGRDLTATVALAAAAASALALANWAAVDALSGSLSSWRAPLLLAAVWAAVAVAIAIALAIRAGNATGVFSWRRLTTLGRDSTDADLVQVRDQARQDVRQALEAVAAAATLEIAGRMAEAAVPLDDVLDAGADIAEATEEMLDEVEERVPGASVVGQVIDLALVPGRFGVRIVTTALRGGDPNRR